MSRTQPLPEYTALIRWTVQEVINWLAENRFNECAKSFREGGVDGNKLVNITEADLRNIKCPSKYRKDIMDLVSRVDRPGCKPRGGFSNQPKTLHRPVLPMQCDYSPADDASGSDDDAECWDEDEFSDVDDQSGSSDDGSLPQAPPRPNRRDLPAALPPSVPSNRQPKLPSRPQETEEDEEYADPEEPPPVRGRPPPPVPATVNPDEPPPLRGRPPPPVPVTVNPDEGEDYDDPDATIKPQNFHRGPLPTPPTETKKKASPIGQRLPPPMPTPDQDDYEEPEVTPPPTHRRIPQMPLPAVPGANQEVYEEPEETPPPTHRRVPQMPLPAVPVSSNGPNDQEDYEEPEMTPPPTHRRIPQMPLPAVPVSSDGPEETYEDPDKSTETPTPPGRRPAAPLPGSGRRQPSQAPAPSPAPAPVPGPASLKGRKMPAPPVMEETYEVPDEVSNKKNNAQQEVYETPDNDEEQDEYLEVNADNNDIPSPQTLPSVKPEKGPRRAAMPLPGAPKPNPPTPVFEKQDTYEIPDVEPVKEIEPKKLRGVSVLPQMSNGVSRTPPPRQRNLPPIPAETVSTPRNVMPEPTPVAPASSSSQSVQDPPREMTDADYARQKWFHSNMNRNEAENKLTAHSVNGMYLIRKSSKENPYTVEIFYNGKVFHLPVRRRSDNMFAIGTREKRNEKTFFNLLEMVNYFKRNKLVLAGGGETKFVRSLPV